MADRDRFNPYAHVDGLEDDLDPKPSFGYTPPGQAANAVPRGEPIQPEQVPPTSSSMCSCFSVDYYKPYFNVDTEDVKNRLLSSIFFWQKEPLLIEIGGNPDAYGPFWLATTLLFTVAVTSNISNWVNSMASPGAWEYDFKVVVTCASIVYSFAALLPLFLWFGAKSLQLQGLSYPNCFCLYGYSLVSFIPAALLHLFPVGALSYLLFLSSGLFSGLFLVKNLYPQVSAIVQYNAVVLVSLVYVMGC